MVKLRSNTKELNVDKEARTIKGIVACEPIDIKDWRPWSVNAEFIQDLVKMANKQKEGVLSNFGHNWNNLGKRLGRATNWRVVDGKALYDLKIFKSADKSPGNKELGTYVMDLAMEDDKAIMNSIVFKTDYYYQERNGEKIKCWYRDKEIGWVTHNPKLGKVYPKLKELKSTDIVDEGAATNSLFSSNELGDVLHEICTNPDFFVMMEACHEEFPMLAEFYSSKLKKPLIKQFKDLFIKAEDDSTLSEDNTTLKNELHNLKSQLNKMEKEKETLEQEKEGLEAENTKLKKDVEKMKSDIKEIKSKIIPGQTLGNEGDGGGKDDTPAYLNSDINRYAKEARLKKENK